MFYDWGVRSCMDNEFAALYELAISQGQKHSDLIASVKQAVLEDFRQKYPESPARATVLVDETTGTVRIYSADRDITPPKYAPQAASVARQAIISRLSPATAAKTPPIVTAAAPSPPGKISGLLANLFFWGYNLYFLLFNLLLVFSFLSSGSEGSLREKLTGLGLFRLLLSVVVLSTPAVSMWWALKNKLYRAPRALLKVFFLFELPLVVASIIPLTLLSQTTGFMVLVTLLLLAVPAILYLYEGEVPLSGTSLKALFFVSEFVTLMWAYLTLLFAFFTPLILGSAAKSLLSGIFDTIVYRPSYGMYPPSPEPFIGIILQLTIGFVLLSLVIGLTLVPFLLLLVLIRALLKTRRLLGAGDSHDLTAIFAVVIVTISAVAAYQPINTELLSALRQITTAPTFAEKEELAQKIIPQEQALKTYINDLLTGRSRYPFTRDDNSLESGYREIFNFDQTQAEFIQEVFLTVAYPFVFQGEREAEWSPAGNFQYVFGYSPYETKKPAPSPTPTGNVLLTYRKVSVTPAAGGLLTTVVVEEEYDNTTYQEQEVIYEFVLPADSAVTDLRLGPSLEYPGVIAPKGSAQKTYERELQRRRDPALLEQTGPSQYRLRVYPIPAKSDLTTLQGRRQKVLYSYVVSATPDGYPLPEFTRKGNILTNSATQFLTNTPASNTAFKEADKFIPLAPGTPDVCRDTPSDVTLTEAGLTATVSVHAKSGSLKSLACGSDQDVLAYLSQNRIAFFFDVSATNKENQTAALDGLKKLLGSGGFLSRNSIDLYKYNDGVSQKTPLTESSLNDLTLNYFGPSDVWTALKLFNETYDLVLVITGAKDIFPSHSIVYPFARSPVYFVHQQAPPPYSLELTSRLLAGRGGAVSSVSEALRQYALVKETGKVSGSVATGPNLSVTLTGVTTDQVPAPFTTEGSALTQYVNKALFDSAVRAQTADVTGSITLLDTFNAFAEGARVITPYSSLISLVNEQQRQFLEGSKKTYERYQDRPTSEAVAPRPQQPLGRIFSPVLPGAELSLPSIGAPEALRDGGGGLSIAGPSAVAVGSGLVSGLGLFVLLNILLLAAGFGFYLFRILRKKR